jgi:hypothetical protein
MEYFLSQCQKMGIVPQAARRPRLIASVQALSHETMLFFLCGQDYIYYPTDLKLFAIERLFIANGAPFALNVGAGAATTLRNLLRATPVQVHTETGGAHVMAFQRGPGIRAGGVANYNLATKALSQAAGGLGSIFLRDMVTGITKVMTRKAPSQVTPQRVDMYVRQMRDATRRSWMWESEAIGL